MTPYWCFSGSAPVPSSEPQLPPSAPLRFLQGFGKKVYEKALQSRPWVAKPQAADWYWLVDC